MKPRRASDKRDTLNSQAGAFPPSPPLPTPLRAGWAFPPQGGGVGKRWGRGSRAGGLSDRRQWRRQELGAAVGGQRNDGGLPYGGCKSYGLTRMGGHRRGCETRGGRSAIGGRASLVRRLHTHKSRDAHSLVTNYTTRCFSTPYPLMPQYYVTTTYSS